MICGKQEHQPGKKCPAKNAKYKACHRIGHFYCMCQSKKKSKPRVNIAQSPQDNNYYHIDENGVRQLNPPRVNMLKIVNHIEANKGEFLEGKHLKFFTASHPKGPFKHNIVVRVDTAVDVNCINEKTFSELFPEVQLSVCPHKIQNANILLHFYTFLYWDNSVHTLSSGV